MVISKTDADMYSAIDRAMERVGHAVSRRLKKKLTRSRRDIRQREEREDPQDLIAY